MVVPTDVSDPRQCKRLVDKTVKKWGYIDVFAQQRRDHVADPV